MVINESGGSMKKILPIITIIMVLVISLTGISNVCAETPSEKGNVVADGSDILFDGEPDEGTGNSAGEIVFMLVIFLVCLFFVIEGVVSFIRKRKKEKENEFKTEASEDDRRR